MDWKSSDVFRFVFGPRQTRIAKLKSPYNSLIIGSKGLQCENNFLEIMLWESSDVIRFRSSFKVNV